ncbi:MAG: TonB-dependent receptor [Proteobacteria bacterium]|nr:TonB-dependent receptor [Pseudomonadota bacterium]
MLTFALKTGHVGVSRRMALVLASAAAIQQAIAADVGDPAGQAANASSRGGDLEEVVVSGHYEFLSVDTSGATNLPLPIEKVPQSISLVSEDFIKAADLKTLGDIAEYTPGALNAGNQEGFGTIIKLRGFSSLQSIDGLNVGTLSGTSYEPDYAIIDRLEVVKGPSSVIYGVSSAGGLVNFVTKSATRTTPSYVSVQGGSWNTYRVEGQIAGALDPAKTLRGIGVVVRDQGDSFMTDVSHANTVVYGGINWSGIDSLSAYLHGGYELHVRTSFDGVPTLEDGSPAPLPRSFLIGSKEMEVRTNVYHAEGDLTWHANSMLDLSIKGNYRLVKTNGIAPYSFGLDPEGNIGLAIQDFTGGLTEKDYGIGVAGVYHFDELGLANSFVSAAAMYQDGVSDAAGGQAIFSGPYAGPDPDNPYVGSVNVSAGQAGVEKAFNSAVPTGPKTFTDLDLRTLTLSIQSVIQVTDHLLLLGGASYAKPRITQVENGDYQDFSSGSQISYRGGLTYEMAHGTNAYVSFSQSFNPQTWTNVNNHVLPPILGEQYEVGVKYRSPDGRLLLTTAVFQITQKNQGQFDTQIDGLDRYRAVGELKHKGIELEGIGRLSRQWQLNVGYAYLDPKVSKDSDPINVGRTEIFLPKQTASLFSTYTLEDGLLHGLSFGAGARYVGPEKTAYDGSTRDIAGYLVLDATAGYSFGSTSVQLNAHNLLDRHYFINNYGTLFYGNAVGEPVNWAITLRHDF